MDEAGFFAAGTNGGDNKQHEGPKTITSNSNTITKETNKTASSLNNHVGFGVQTRLLFDREIKKLWRDKFSFLTRVGSSVVFGLLFGFIFLNVGKSSYEDYPEVMASFGAIANLLISTMFGVAQSSLTEFPKDRPVFLREYSTNHYSVLPYFVAKFTMECILILLQVSAQLVASFFLMGFQMNFFYFLAVNFTLAIASTSIGVFIGSSVEDPAVAAELMPALVSIIIQYFRLLFIFVLPEPSTNIDMNMYTYIYTINYSLNSFAAVSFLHLWNYFTLIIHIICMYTDRSPIIILGIFYPD